MNQQVAIKVFHIIDHLGLGGAQTFLLDLALEQQKSGRIHPVLCVLRENTALSDRYRTLGLEIEHLGVRRNNLMEILSILPRLIRRLRGQPVDLVHTHLFASGFFGRLAARFSGVPVIIHEQRNESEHTNLFGKWIDRHLGSLASAVICVSESTRDFNVHEKGIDPHKAEVIPNAINLDRFHREAFKMDPAGCLDDLDLPPTAKIVIGVGRLVPEKRFEVFLKAARLIHEAYPEARFLILGDGSERGSLERLAESLGIGSATRFAGMRSDVLALLSCSHVFVLTSDYEGLPLTLLEAMALQVPAVATDVDGTSEVLSDGAGGIVVPRNSPEAVADAVVSLLRDERRAQDIGLQGRRLVEEKYNIQVVQEQTYAVYQSILGSARFV